MKPTAATSSRRASAKSVRRDFEDAFNAWFADAASHEGVRQPSSEAVYRAIWNSFADWCMNHAAALRPLQVSIADLRSFLRSRQGTVDPRGQLSDRHTWTVLNLIDRVLRHAARARRVDINDAPSRLIALRPEVRYANANGPALPDHLSASEARTLVRFLAPSRKTVQLETGSVDGEPQDRWQDLRNRAAVALQLGAGLAPGDVRSITLSGVVSAGGSTPGIPWKLRVPADGNTPERDTPIAPWAGRLLLEWLDVRAAQAIPGIQLFPSTRTGKPWSKMAQYRSAQQVLSEAGIEASDGGSFRLRHTFALRQLRRGTSVAEIARWMGIARLETLERYRQVLEAPADVD